jgi:hypothetical protein
MKKSQSITLLWIVLLAFASTNLIQMAISQTQPTVKLEKTLTTINVGTPFTISVTLTNVQNLYGVEVILKWNPTILQATHIDTRLGIESHPDGILHESTNSAIFEAENTLNQNIGEYRLVATSTSPAPPFSGSGNIVKITFNPISPGNSLIDLQSELSDYPPTDREPRVSNLIQHTTQDLSITITAQNQTIAPTPIPSDQTSITPTPSTQPTNDPSSTQTSNQKQPKLDTVLFVLLTTIIAILVLTFVFVAKKRKKEPAVWRAN